MSSIGTHSLASTQDNLKAEDPQKLSLAESYREIMLLVLLFFFPTQQSSSLCQGVKIHDFKLIGYEFYVYHHWGRV